MTTTEAWDYAIGMVKMAGLEPTEEFIRYIEKEKSMEDNGDISIHSLFTGFTFDMNGIHVIVEVGSRKKRPALNSCFKSLFIWWGGNERNGYYRSMICSAISFYMLFYYMLF